MSERNRLISNNSATAEYELQTYSKRWILSLLIGIQIVNNRFTVSSFGTINDVFVNYFNISYAAVDWFTLIAYPGATIANILMIFRSMQKKIGFRQLSIFASFISLLAYILIMIAVTFSSTYSLIYICQLLIAIAIATLGIMNTEVAKSWYPDKEVGRALSVYAIGNALGAMLVSIVPSHVITYNNQTFSHNITLLHFHNSSMNEMCKVKIKIQLYKQYGPLLLISIISFFLFVIISENRPPKPPSVAQAQIRNIDQQLEATESGTTEYRLLLQECKKIVFNKTMLIISVAKGFKLTFIIMVLAYLSEILREVFEKLAVNVKPDVLSGYVLLSCECARFLGSLASGIGLDRFQKLKLQVVVVVSFASISSLCLALNCYYRILVGIFIFVIITGLAYGYAFIFPYEIVYRNLHPIKPEKLFPIIQLLTFVIAIFMSVFYRIILNYSSGVWVIVFQSVLIIISALMFSLVKVKSVALNK